MKCADCTMSGIPCPECYRVHWKKMYPGDEARMREDTLDLRMIIRWFLRNKNDDEEIFPLPVNMVALLELHNFTLDGKHTDADITPKSVNMVAIDKLHDRIVELDGLINTPEVINFTDGVIRESAHQRQRWGEAKDREKSAEHWFWLVGYLAGKALRAHMMGDKDKAKHHTISSAAALHHWHSAIGYDKSGSGLGRDADLEAHDNGRQAHETAPVGPAWQHTQECTFHNSTRLGNGDMPQCICGDPANATLAELLHDELPHS